MCVIRDGLKSGVDVSIYADPKYDWTQMRVIYAGLRDGLDVSSYADPDMDPWDMTKIRKALMQQREE